jgi:2,3-bisphosphoglycerate-independent phosphoglycerate mutase
LGDRPYKELNHKTPLEAAHTPVLDRIAANGASGLYHAGIMGQALPSENAHFALFGYDLDAFPGRGAIEALGAGIGLRDTDVGILAHFVSMEKKENVFWLKQNKPILSDEEFRAFFALSTDVVMEGIHFRFVPTHNFRGILVLSGGVSPFITDTDPFINGRPLIEPEPLAMYTEDMSSQNTAKALKNYILHVHRVLKDHELNRQRKKENKPIINGVVTQRPGRLRMVMPFCEKYGLAGCSISSGLVYRGLAAYLGMDHKAVEDTERPGGDLAHRIQMAYQMRNQYDFIHVHTKTPDEAAHTSNPVAKKQVIESLDEGVGSVIQPLLEDPDILLVVASDHSTPSSGPLIHSGEPVPVIMHGSNVRKDDVKAYDEIHAANGLLGHLRGKEIIYLILSHLNKIKLAGIMDCPEDQPFWPGRYKPFWINGS